MSWNPPTRRIGVWENSGLISGIIAFESLSRCALRRSERRAQQKAYRKAQRACFLSPPRRFVTQEDGMPGTALFQAASHALHFDREPAMAQTLLEFPILAGRPDR
jgi:hypothetical protein